MQVAGQGLGGRPFMLEYIWSATTTVTICSNDVNLTMRIDLT